MAWSETTQMSRFRFIAVSQEEVPGEEVPGDSRKASPSLGVFRPVLSAESHLQPSLRARLPALAEEISESRTKSR
jgi:hypothetical protein